MVSFIKECEIIPNGFYVKTGFLTLETNDMNSIVTRGADNSLESICYFPKEKRDTSKIWFTLGLKLWKLHISLRVREYMEPRFIWRFN